MKKFYLILIALFFIACNSSLRHHITINDQNGIDTDYIASKQELKIKDLHEPFILFFYSTTCGACTKQIPSLNNLQNKFKNKIKIIGILGNTKGFDADMKIIKEKGVKFITISDKRSVGYFSNLVGGVYGAPATYIFDKEGKISKRFLGLVPESTLEHQIKLLI